MHHRNPIRDPRTGKPLSCPDPSVIRAPPPPRGPSSYVLVCTSDNARNAFPIWTSTDLVHWRRDGFVFPHGDQPGWAVPSDGHTRLGKFWGPAIYWIDGHWQLYFAAAYDDTSGALGSVQLPASTMVLGVATASSLKGPWQSQLLHYPGEFNGVNAPPMQELGGGDIDPAVVRDPRTGRRYIFWAEQRQQIWEGALSPDGDSIDPHVQLALGVSKLWECDPVSQECTVEGPQPIYHDHRFYLLYSAASTWDSSYAVGVARSSAVLDVTQPFQKLGSPILRSGNGFLGPGGESAPVLAPDGREMIMYHALTHPIVHHVSRERYLMLGQLRWIDGWPLIDDGVAQ